MVGGAIGFASTTAFPAVAKTERERSRAMSLRGDAIRQAKAARPYRIRNAKAFPSDVIAKAKLKHVNNLKLEVELKRSFRL